MQKVLADGNGLPGQPGAEVAPMAGEGSEVVDGVVEGFVSRSEGVGVEGGEVVLVVDPLGHEEGGGHDCFQRLPVRVGVGVVGMQKHPSFQVAASTDVPRADEQRRVSGEPEFGKHFCPVMRATPDGAGFSFRRGAGQSFGAFLGERV